MSGDGCSNVEWAIMDTPRHKRVDLIRKMIQFMARSELESVVSMCNRQIAQLTKNTTRRKNTFEILRTYFGHSSGAHTTRSSKKSKETESLLELPYDLPPEVAISDFNRRWKGSVSSGSSKTSSGSSTNTQSEPEKTVNDFHLLKTIGKGAFGKVLLVQCRGSGQFYAMKVLDKRSVINNDNVKGVLNEKRVLQCVSFPFLVQLYFHFKDAVNLFIVMEFVGGGDLFFHLRRRIVFSEKEALFYGGQITLALEYLHSLNVIYRDLKPENILINYDGYIKLTDFGLAKRLSTLGHTRSMVGTAEYLAPEIFLQKLYGKSVDWWALGILLYELVHGKSPFKSATEAETFEKILSGKMKFGQVSSSYKNLIHNLVKDEVDHRLGAKSVDDIKNHAWFETLSWSKLLEKKLEPPFIPKQHHRGDTRFFDNYSDNLRDIHYVPSSDQDVYKDCFIDF